MLIWVKKRLIETDVIDSELPLLLSKEAMKKAKMINGFVNDKAKVLGNVVSLEFTSSGHYTLPLTKERILVVKDTLSTEDRILVGLKIQDKSYKEMFQIASKLHTQFGHLSQSKLQNLLKQAGDHFLSILESISFDCKICAKYKRSNRRPAVGFSLAKDFNDTVAMDLKPHKGVHFLHLIDLATRYSNAIVIHSKGKEVIVKNIMLHWIAIFTATLRFLSDNGGEFNNYDFQGMSENLNVETVPTAGESPWSIGVVKRHNAVIGNMVDKIIADTDCSLEIALAWAVNAKNSLHSVHGCIPNQLAFGCNPNLPSCLNDKTSALEGITSSGVVVKNLNAFHAARKAFTEHEAYNNDLYSRR